MKAVHTTDLDDQFFPGLLGVAEAVQARPVHLLSVMMAESGVRASAWNRNGNASGLIQFMPATLVGLGWTSGHEAFRKLTATQQLPYVRKYFHPHKGRLVSVGAVYVATFLPALLKHAHDPDFVLTAKGGRLSWAYEPNKVFDVDKNYAITVRELEDAVHRACRGARWVEIVSRLAGYDMPRTEPDVANLADDDLDDDEPTRIYDRCDFAVVHPPVPLGRPALDGWNPADDDDEPPDAA